MTGSESGSYSLHNMCRPWKKSNFVITIDDSSVRQSTRQDNPTKDKSASRDSASKKIIALSDKMIWGPRAINHSIIGGMPFCLKQKWNSDRAVEIQISIHMLFITCCSSFDTSIHAENCCLQWKNFFDKFHYLISVFQPLPNHTLLLSLFLRHLS